MSGSGAAQAQRPAAKTGSNKGGVRSGEQQAREMTAIVTERIRKGCVCTNLFGLTYLRVYVLKCQAKH